MYINAYTQWICFSHSLIPVLSSLGPFALLPAMHSYEIGAHLALFRRCQCVDSRPQTGQWHQWGQSSSWAQSPVWDRTLPCLPFQSIHSLSPIISEAYHPVSLSHLCVTLLTRHSHSGCLISVRHLRALCDQSRCDCHQTIAQDSFAPSRPLRWKESSLPVRLHQFCMNSV